MKNVPPPCFKDIHFLNNAEKPDSASFSPPKANLAILDSTQLFDRRKNVAEERLPAVPTLWPRKLADGPTIATFALSPETAIVEPVDAIKAFQNLPQTKGLSLRKVASLLYTPPGIAGPKEIQGSSPNGPNHTITFGLLSSIFSPDDHGPSPFAGPSFLFPRPRGEMPIRESRSRNNDSPSQGNAQRTQNAPPSCLHHTRPPALKKLATYFIISAFRSGRCWGRQA